MAVFPARGSIRAQCPGRRRDFGEHATASQREHAVGRLVEDDACGQRLATQLAVRAQTTTQSMRREGS